MRTGRGGLRAGAPWRVEIELGGQTREKVAKEQTNIFPERGVALSILLMVSSSAWLLVAGVEAEFRSGSVDPQRLGAASLPKPSLLTT